jgi:hypothetical protein
VKSISGLRLTKLTEVVLGFSGPCDDTIARAGIEWMRD